MKSTIKRRLSAASVSLVLALGGCESLSDADPSTADPNAVEGQTSENALSLRPELTLTGLSDVHDAVRLTELSLSADLFILPESGDGPGDVIPAHYVFTNGRSTTVLPDRGLQLPKPGRYQVLVRVRPQDEGPAVTVRAEVEDDALPADRRKEQADEPAPSPARPVSPADAPADEPAPSPARSGDDEPAPSPARSGDDEPAPSPAHPSDDEPAPSPAEPADAPADEPAPSPAYNNDLPSSEQDERADEPAPSPARHKDELDVFDVADGASTVFTRSDEAYEFYAGVVVVSADSTELVVTWDARRWLRVVLADALGLDTQTPETDAREAVFNTVNDSFRVEAR